MTVSLLPSSDFFTPPLAGRLVMGELYSDHLVTIPIPEILYAFSGSAALRGLVDVSLLPLKSFRSAHFYVRTADGVFVVFYRSLTELRKRLGDWRFQLLNTGVCVNLYQKMKLDLRSKRKRIGITIKDKTVEWLDVSRRHATALYEWFGIHPRRRKYSQKHDLGKTLKSPGPGPGRPEFCEKD